MLTTCFKTLLSRPLLASPALKATLAAPKLPFQASIVQRSFSRHAKPPQSTITKTTSQTQEEETFRAEPFPTATGPNVDQIIREDTNLNKFMSRIYRTTGFSIMGSLSLSYLLATSSVAIGASPFVTIFGGLALSIGGIIAMNRIPPEIVLEKGKGKEMVEKWTNPLSRQIAFSSIIAGSGIMISPFIQGLCMINPGIIPMAAGLSFFTMGGASLYAMYKPLGHFKAWESTLYGGLLALIGMNLTSILLTACIGPNVFSLACGKIDMYVGLGLFTAFQAMDTQVAVQAYKDGNYDHLMHVVNFFLNFKNIFIRIASIMANLRGDD